VYDLETSEGSVFAEPTPMEDGLGFVSMLACFVHCPTEEDEPCSLVTTDFAGGLRVFDLQGSMDYAVGTTYTPDASTGSMSIGMDGMVYVPGFLNETTPGVVMRFELATGAPMPLEGLEGALFIQNDALVRPVGILVLEDPPQEPGTEGEREAPSPAAGPTTAAPASGPTAKAPASAPTASSAGSQPAFCSIVPLLVTVLLGVIGMKH
jgi:hypothetical protein